MTEIGRDAAATKGAKIPRTDISKLELAWLLFIEGGLYKDPVVLFAIGASVGRAGLIYAINTIATSSNSGWPVALLAVSAIGFLASSYQSRIRVQILVARMQQRLRESMSRQLLAANADFLLRRDHGAIFSLMTREVEQVSRALNNVIEFIEASILVMVCLPYLVSVSWVAALATLGALGIGAATYRLLDIPARRYSRQTSVENAEFCDRVEDMLAGWKELRLRRSRTLELETAVIDNIDRIARSTIRTERLFSASEMMAQAALVFLLSLIVLLVPHLSGADSTVILQILTVVLMTLSPVETLFSTLPRLSRAQASYMHMRTIQQALLAAQAGPGGGPGVELPANGFASVELRDICVHLGGGRDPDNGGPIQDRFDLGPINMTLKPGEAIFITGGNGAGKSTLLDVLVGLRPPDSGVILWNGKPVGLHNIDAYRQLFSAVFSGFHLFHRPYGLSVPELDELERQIGVLGLSAQVSLRGGVFSRLALSSGQKRRLAMAIARAESTPIIVLDEFAADQDPGYRSLYYDILIPEMTSAGRLVIAITHDDHQFSKCDRLIKMEFGKIVSDVKQRLV